MAEVVEYRVEKTIDELNLLVEFGLFNENQAKEIIAKRQNFEYKLRRRNRTKLDYLKYIKFEINLLESIEKYRKTVIKNHYIPDTHEEIDDLERQILFLQAKKLGDIIRSRTSNVSSLFRKLTSTFQFDSKLWLAYIEFTKTRNWTSLTSALYWRLLRVHGSDSDLWLAAASHELDVNNAYDTARGLYLRALRHFPKCPKVWADYFKMEVRFMDVVDRRARIVFKTLNAADTKETDDIWANDDEPDAQNEDEFEDVNAAKEEVAPDVKPIEDNDIIITGHLPKVIYKNATLAVETSKDYRTFLKSILNYLLTSDSQSAGIQALIKHICDDILTRHNEGDNRISNELATNSKSINSLTSYISSELKKDKESEETSARKRMKKGSDEKMIALYEVYETKGIHEARHLFENLEKSVKNQKLSLYVSMIQVEMWQLMKDKSKSQLDKVRAIYEKALGKYGKVKPKLWYEYLQVEYDNAKSLEDFNRVNQIYTRAQATLSPDKVNRVIEKYTLLQVNSSSTEIYHSDYSDLDN